MKVYLFGWPGNIGGASTKFAHLVGLLRRAYPIRVVALDRNELANTTWTDWLTSLHVPFCHISELPKRLQGWGVSICNSEFIGSPQWVEVRRRGLKMAWGNEMMWPLPRETGALALGQVDTILYVSPVQRIALEPHYQRTLCGDLEDPMSVKLTRRKTGVIRGESADLPWVMVGNYIDPAAFPFRERDATRRERLVIGRLSRPDPAKFPVDFPQSFEQLGLKRPRFKVMAWSTAMSAKWAAHVFDGRWELIQTPQGTPEFLQSLDLFVYEPGPSCRESWGRAMVEAMLAGAIPLLPRGGGHHLENLIVHGESGFLCRTRPDFGKYARYLQDHPARRTAMARQCRKHAITRLCNARAHLALWDVVFQGC